MTISRLIYVSTARQPVRKGLVDDILNVARARNEALGITGLLLFDGSHFIQLLEGEAGKVSTLFDRIGQDPRHRNVIRIAHETNVRRQFPDWSMGFHASDGLLPEGRHGWFALTNHDLAVKFPPQVDPDIRMIFTSFTGFQPALG